MVVLRARMLNKLWRFAQEHQINGALRARTSEKWGASRKNVNHFRFAQNSRKNYSLKEERYPRRCAVDAHSSFNEWWSANIFEALGQTLWGRIFSYRVCVCWIPHFRRRISTQKTYSDPYRTQYYRNRYVERTSPRIWKRWYMYWFSCFRTIR